MTVSSPGNAEPFRKADADAAALAEAEADAKANAATDASAGAGAGADTEVARIFVGCDPNDCDLEQMMVLEYSLRRHASIPVEIHWMQLSHDPSNPWYSEPSAQSGWRTEKWVTPFSGFRWGIPASCGYTGRAIYMDADMIVLRDIAGLWRTPLAPGQVLAATQRKKRSWRHCVMVWDCAAARAHLPPLAELQADPDAHSRLTHFFNDHPQYSCALHRDENNLDGEDRPIGDIRILHYTDIGTQLSHRHAFARLAAEGRQHWFDGEVMPHPRRELQALFDEYYEAALAAGHTLDRYRAPQRYGPVVKASQADYAGNRRTRHMPLWRRLKLAWTTSRR